MIEYNELLETASDVVVRLKAHGQYKGSVDLAVKALKRRAAGFADYEYRDLIAFLCNIYDTAADIINNLGLTQNLDFNPVFSGLIFLRYHQ